MIDDTLLEAEEKMERAIAHAKEEFATIRTGRASAAIFAKIMVDYYGTPTPLPQLASVGVPEPRMAIIKPYDPSQIAAMEKAVRDSDLGVNPSNEGTQLRVVLPPMTEERRREMIKLARHKAEEARVAIRNIRRDANKHADQAEKDKILSEDDCDSLKEEIQNLTKTYEGQVNSYAAAKEKEIMEE